MIAGFCPHRLVEHLDVIDVRQQQGIVSSGLAAYTRERALQAVQEHSAIGQSRSRSWNKLYSSSLLGTLALRDVPVDDNQLRHFALSSADRAGDRLQHAPAFVLVLDAVLEALADSALTRFSRRYEHPHAVVGMNLLKRRRLTQFRGSVAEHALVRRAVVQASFFDVNQSDHVRGVFGDHLEDLVLLPEFAVGVEDPQLLGDHENGVWGSTGLDLVPITSNQDVGPATRLKRMLHPVVKAGTFEAVLSRGPSAPPAGTFPQPNYVTSALAFHSLNIRAWHHRGSCSLFVASEVIWNGSERLP